MTTLAILFLVLVAVHFELARRKSWTALSVFNILMIGISCALSIWVLAS